MRGHARPLPGQCRLSWLPVDLDCNCGPPALPWRQSLIAEAGKPPTLDQAADLLFGPMMVGDDRAIDQTWAMGRQVYQRPTAN